MAMELTLEEDTRRYQDMVAGWGYQRKRRRGVSYESVQVVIDWFNIFEDRDT